MEKTQDAAITFSAVFKPREQNVRTPAVAVYCYDPRFQAATEEFLEHLRKIPSRPWPRITRISGAGDAYDLCRHESDSLNLSVLNSLNLTVSHHGAYNIILILHEGCARYTENENKQAVTDPLVFAKSMFTCASSLIRRRVKADRLTIRCYWATLDGEFREIVF